MRPKNLNETESKTFYETNFTRLNLRPSNKKEQSGHQYIGATAGAAW